MKDHTKSTMLHEALKSGFNLIFLLEIYHILAMSTETRKLVLAEPHLIEYLKGMLISTGHQEGRTCGFERTCLVDADLQLLAKVPTHGLDFQKFLQQLLLQSKHLNHGAVLAFSSEGTMRTKTG